MDICFHMLDFDVQHVLESSWLWWEECSGNTCSQNLERGNYVKSRAKNEWIKGFEKWFLERAFMSLPFDRLWQAGAWRSLQLSYWCICSCPQIMQVCSSASLRVRVTLEHERHGVVCCSCVLLFLSLKFFLPYVISYMRLRATKGNLSNSSWGRPQWSSGAGCPPCHLWS